MMSSIPRYPEARGHDVAHTVMCVAAMGSIACTWLVLASSLPLSEETWGPMATWSQNAYLAAFRGWTSRISAAGHLATSHPWSAFVPAAALVALGTYQRALARRRALWLLGACTLLWIVAGLMLSASSVYMMIGPLR